ncbi:MAG: MFS transporter, partial [Ignavibacteriaceae bacterium]|nr:MFS transporter [Ignavibacteriaceae bacterium]
TITGALYSILGIFSTISSAFFSKKIDKLGISKTLFLGASTTGLMYLIHYFVVDIYMLVPVRILLGLGYGIIIPVLFTALSKDIPEVRKGGIMGIGSSFQILGNMIGPVTAGTLAAMIGLRPTFLFAGIIFISIGLFSNFRLKKY